MKQILLNIQIFFNSSLLIIRPISWWVLNNKFHKQICEINKKYHDQGNTIPLKEMKTAIFNTYYKKQFFDRKFLSNVVLDVVFVKNIFPFTKENAQGRNEKCNCKSGKKYKHCCLIKK